MTKTPPEKPAKKKVARAGTSGGGTGVIETALVHLIREKPFYGHVILGFQRHLTEMPEPIGMNITKAPNLFINLAAFAAYKLEQQSALLEHVVLHCINLHPLRVLMGWEPELWHLACDLAINQFIEQMPDEAPSLAAFPFLKANERAEVYYDELVKRMPPPPPPPPGGGGKSKNPRPDPNAPQGGGDADDENEAQGGSGGTGGKQGKTPPKPIDSAAQWADSIPDPEYMREVVRDLVKKATEHLTQDEWGHLPGGIKSLVEGLKRPRENWKAVLDRFVNFARMVVREESRKRPNRRFGRAIPGYATRPELNLVLCVDTSGSISDDDLAEFNGRMARLCEDVDVTIIECDADVQRVYKGRKKLDREFFGRGGTNFIPALEKAAEIEADAVVYLTDGWGDFPKRRPHFPVLWAVTPSGRQDRDFPFGRTMRLKFED